MGISAFSKSNLPGFDVKFTDVVFTAYGGIIFLHELIRKTRLAAGWLALR